MKALVLDGPNSAFNLRDLPEPVAGPGEVVAKVLACGSGLTIQHVKAGRVSAKFPRVIGHEIAASVVEVGAGVAGLGVGDGVTAYYYLNCGHCRWCHANLEPLCENSGGNVGRDCDGGYAEYIKLPAASFLSFPPELEIDRYPAEAAVIGDALATPYKVLRRSQTRPGETVAIIGAGGGVGLHQVMIAKWARARVIAVDLSEEKLKSCAQAGADEVINAASEDVADSLLAHSEGKGVDVVIDYVSSRETLSAGAKSLGCRGRLVTLGGAGGTFQANASEMLLKEQSILGSRYVTRADILEVMVLAARGDIWPIVTEKCRLEDVEALHDRIEGGDIVGRAVIMVADTS